MADSRGTPEDDLGLQGIVRQLLGNMRVVDPGLQEAVVEACSEIWTDLGDEDVVVGGYRAGTLNLLLDSHARLAEAKNFAGEGLRRRINEILAARHEDEQTLADQVDAQASRSLAHAKRVAGTTRNKSEGNYVTRIHFYLRGTK